jgi:zinc and cadmium transporter
MPTAGWIIVASLLGSVGSLVGAALLLLAPGATRRGAVSHLISFAVGTLLGAAFLAMLPRALANAPAKGVLATALAGFVGFFILEKWVIWRHCHEADCDVHSAAGALILAGDAFHNFVDGLAIASAFLVSVPLGTSTSLAVIAHEVPQELGDFAILLDSGYTARRAFTYNLLSSLTTLPGALLAYLALSASAKVVPYVLAVSAASFIYIAAADLIPGLHRHRRQSGTFQLLLMLAGIATVLLVPRFLGAA